MRDERLAGERSRSARSRTRGAGRSRSVPPPCRSSVGPCSCIAIAEHSMCQPGRPTPNGARHAGSSAQRRLPQHEVERLRGGADRRGCRPAPRASLTIAVFGVVRELAEVGEGRHVEVHRAVAQVRVARVEQPADELDDLRRSTRSRAARRPAGASRARPCRRGSAPSRPRRARGTGTPSSRALGRIESSTSVMLRTMRTSWPSSSSRRISRS